MNDDAELIWMHNRGTDSVPFGFVYVDGTRVGFADAMVFLASGWHAGEEQLEKAAEYLSESFGYEWYPEEY